MQKLKHYRLYVDEYGSDHFDPKRIDEFDKRFLCVVGIIMELDDAHEMSRRLEAFKTETIRDHIRDPDEKNVPIILHRMDIESKKGVFGLFKDQGKLARFNQEWLIFLEQSKFKIISVTIDKFSLLNRQYYTIKDPYHYAAEVLVEKYVQFLQRVNGTGDIMPEERRGKKDEELQNRVDSVIVKGTKYISSDDIQQSLSAKKLKFRPKSENIAGLQIADMIAKTCAKYTYELKHRDQKSLKNYELLLVPVLEKKFDRSEWHSIWGYGIKYLP